MAATNTINIRGAVLYEVTSSSDTATTTTVAAVLAISELPSQSSGQRNATKLTDTVQVQLPGRIGNLGQFAFSQFVTAAGYTYKGRASKFLRLDIPADKDGTATTHEIVRVWMNGAFSEENLQPGNDTEEVSANCVFILKAAPTIATATAALI